MLLFFNVTVGAVTFWAVMLLSSVRGRVSDWGAPWAGLWSVGQEV